MISPDGKTNHERCKAEFGESLKALQVLLAELVAQGDTAAVAWLIWSLEAVIKNTREYF